MICGKRLGLLIWGLIPSWTKEKKGTGHINARVETLDKKPSFRESFLKRRCLVPADGYYEWKADPENGNRKIRYHIQLPSGEPFAFAGLWDFWQKDYSGCAIITREAVGEIKDIHDRMPCVLKPEDWESWLDSSYRDVQGLKKVLHRCCDVFRFQSRKTTLLESTLISNQSNEQTGYLERHTLTNQKLRASR